MQELFDLSGRHYVITGGASGLGRATAVLLSRLKATLSLVDIDEAGLHETVRLCESSTVKTLQFDLRNTTEIESLVARIVAENGKLNGFVHCAGIQSVAPAKTLTVEKWREIFAINTEAALAIAKYVQSKKYFAGSNGSIVFISSVIGKVGSPGAVAYSMSKSALHGICKGLALEFASKAIRVNCIAPGFVRTPMLERVGKMWSPEQLQAVEKQHPLGLGEPQDIANAVAFLLADTGRWITGSVLVVDGGYLAQ
jgi:NAD(P)-dependent dehydrogenase (short-subunit alcohol dehydrogenase family)